jgi:predicted AAA+ superfamily ATPase
MNTTPRYLSPYIKQDLKEKMVFIGGPRQVGKTTLSRMFLKENGLYLNWDNLDDRKEILNFSFMKKSPIIIFDEIHKYRLWRGFVKGLFDKYQPELKIMVTGSARLDHFRKGGDSLVGRFHYHRLHPLTLPEISKKCEVDLVKELMMFGGFPEPFFKQNSTFLKRWQRERVSRVVTQDLHDIENVKDISLIELLTELLYSKVGSLLSIKSLQEDLSISPNTVERWVGILENLYFCYRIYPYGVNRIKAVKKTPKLYLWDWSMVNDESARFENLVASHLLKYCHFHEDNFGENMQLCFLKDVEGGKEIDFVVLKNKKPLFGVECKTGERSLHKNVTFYQEKLMIPKMYQVHLGEKDFGHAEKGGRVLPFSTFCLEEGIL